MLLCKAIFNVHLKNIKGFYNKKEGKVLGAPYAVTPYALTVFYNSLNLRNHRKIYGIVINYWATV